MNRRINVRAVVWRDGTVLAVRHRYPDGSVAEHWALPGGGLDDGETLENGVKRELLEETGITVSVRKLLFVHQFYSRGRAGQEVLEFFFHLDDSPNFDAIDLLATTHGSDEIAEVGFVNPKEVLIRPAFLSELDIADYIESDRPTYIANNLG